MRDGDLIRFRNVLIPDYGEDIAHTVIAEALDTDAAELTDHGRDPSMILWAVRRAEAHRSRERRRWKRELSMAVNGDDSRDRPVEARTHERLEALEIIETADPRLVEEALTGEQVMSKYARRRARIRLREGKEPWRGKSD